VNGLSGEKPSQQEQQENGVFQNDSVHQIDFGYQSGTKFSARPASIF